MEREKRIEGILTHFERQYQIDGADEAKRRDITGMTNGLGKMACKAFSKSLIVPAI